MIKILKKQTIEINADISISGSKSFTNRAIILASHTPGETILENFSDCDDTNNMINALENFGIKFNKTGKNLVIKRNGELKKFRGKINCGHSGTTIRFLTSFISSISGTEVELSGSKRMHERPVNDLIDSLKKFGADIRYLENKGRFPILIKGKDLNLAKKFIINGEKSSQFLSSIMLLAPTFKKGFQVEISRNLVSKSYIQMTIDVLKEFGFEVENNNFRSFKIISLSPYSREGGNLVVKNTSKRIKIETDLSGASYFWGIGALNGKVRIKNINPKTSQGDIQFVDFLEKMGAIISRDSNSITVESNKNLKGIEANMDNCPDIAQTLAVVASFADGITILNGLSTLKSKETDRLIAVQNELKKMGIKTEVGDDFIKIYGGNPNPAKIETYDDHRMAMAFAVASARLDKMEIINPEVVSKSFTNFWDKLNTTMFPRNYLVITEKESKNFIKSINKYQEKFEYLELRTDFIKNLTEQDVLEISNQTFNSNIFTCRRKDEGGKWEKSEEERLNILNFAGSQDFDLIDIEYQTALENPDWFNEFNLEKVLLSFHDFEKTSNLEEIFKKMIQIPAKIYKIIPTAKTEKDCEKVYNLLNKFSKEYNLISFSMGEIGKKTRINGFKCGNFAGYSAVNGKTSAPGQISI